MNAGADYFRPCPGDGVHRASAPGSLAAGVRECALNGGNVHSPRGERGHMAKSAIYAGLEARWRRGEPTVLDGGIGSELQAMGYPPPDRASGEKNYTWGSMALYD